jgi:hypothetical protein
MNEISHMCIYTDSGTIIVFSILSLTLKPFKPPIVFKVFRILVRTSKTTKHCTVIKIKRLMLFKEVIAF